jgi:glycerophosphoryl diester phosphodiesterase
LRLLSGDGQTFTGRGKMHPMGPITFAHRGARLEEPENTIPAFRRGLQAGAKGLESDAWLARDGEVVLVHDGTVGRALRRRKVPASTAAELAEFGVPRLADLYAELGTDYELSIDVKDDAVVEPMLAVARAAGAESRLWICAPDVGLLGALRSSTDARLVHSERRDHIHTPLERHAYELSNLGIDAMNMHHSDWSAGLVALFHRFDVLAFAWDVQEVRHLRAVLKMHIDAIYCDRPDRMVATVGEWAATDSEPGDSTVTGSPAD